MRRHRGQSVLYVVLLFPTLLLVLAMSVELAFVQATSVKLRSAVDLASVAGASVVDARTYAQTGQLRLDAPAAAATARDVLARNLSVDGPNHDLAASAEVSVINDTPARDPYSGALLDRPAVCIRARIVRPAGLLRLAGLPAHLTLTATSDAELRG